MKTFADFLQGKEISNDDFAKKTAEQMAELHNEYNAEIRTEIKNLIDAKASKDEIESLKTQLNENLVKQMDSLNQALKDQGIAIKKLSIDEKQDSPMTIRKALDKVKESLTALKTGERKDWISIKAVGTMLESANISGGNVPIEQRIAGMDALASRRVRLLDLVSRGTASSNVISWVSQANKEGAAGTTAEGALKNQIDFDLVVTSENLKKITAFIKVSDEMIDDIDFMETEINNELLREVSKVIESQVYSGDGTGNNLNGIRTVATAFAAGPHAGKVDNANFVDVIRAAMDQIERTEQEPATAILANPSDVTALMFIKATSTDKRYVDALQMIGGQLMVDGIPIVKTTLVAADTYLVGNFPSSTVWDRGQVSVEVGLDSDDFTKNLRTIRAEWRGLNIVKTNKRGAFIKGTISTDAAALETP